MPDFFPVERELTIGEIVALTRAKPRAGIPLDRRIGNIAPLDTARAFDISFLDNKKYLGQLAVTHAGACLLKPHFEDAAPDALAVLVTAEPYRAFVAVARALFPAALRPSSLFGTNSRAGSANVHASARIEAAVTIDPVAVIGPGVEIGAGTLIAAGAVVGPGVAIGRDCAIGAGATVLCALVGDRVIIHPGARIGQDGFGYLPVRRGIRKSRKLAASSFRTTSRSAPTPRSTAAGPEHGHRRGHEDRQSGANRTQLLYRAALRDRVANRNIRQRGGGRFRHAGRPGRHRRSSDDRERSHTRRAGGRHLERSAGRALGRLPGRAGGRLETRSGDRSSSGTQRS